MVNRKEILRLKSLELTHQEIAAAAGCGRNTVTRTLALAGEQQLGWQQAPCLHRKPHRSCFRLSKRTPSTQCRTTNGYTVKCRRAASP